MSGKRGLDGGIERFGVADFTDHDHIGIVPEKGSEGFLEIDFVAGVDLALCDALHFVFDGILDGEDIQRRVGEQVSDGGIEGCGFSGAGRAGQEDEPIGMFEDPFEGFAVFAGHAERLEGEPVVFGRQKA